MLRELQIKSYMSQNIPDKIAEDIHEYISINEIKIRRPLFATIRQLGKSCEVASCGMKPVFQKGILLRSKSTVVFKSCDFHTCIKS